MGTAHKLDRAEFEREEEDERKKKEAKKKEEKNGKYQWMVAGSYYFGLFPGPNGPPNDHYYHGRTAQSA